MQSDTNQFLCPKGTGQEYGTWEFGNLGNCLSNSLVTVEELNC